MTPHVVFISLILLGSSVACSPNAKTVSGVHGSSNSNSVATQKSDKPKSIAKELKFTLIATNSEWQLGSPDSNSIGGLVKLHVENSSDQDIQLRGPGIFLLFNESSQKERDQFHSGSALPGPTTTELTPSGEHTIKHSWIRCAKYGTLDLEIDLRTVKWKRQNQSQSPNQDFARVVTPGRYHLLFVFTVGESMNEEIPISTIFESNRVNLVIN